jgi:hypothetical protein
MEGSGLFKFLINLGLLGMDIDFIFFHLRACITILGKSNAQQIKAQA